MTIYKIKFNRKATKPLSLSETRIDVEGDVWIGQNCFLTESDFFYYNHDGTRVDCCFKGVKASKEETNLYYKIKIADKIKEHC